MTLRWLRRLFWGKCATCRKRKAQAVCAGCGDRFCYRCVEWMTWYPDVAYVCRACRDADVDQYFDY